MTKPTITYGHKWFTDCNNVDPDGLSEDWSTNENVSGMLAAEAELVVEDGDVFKLAGTTNDAGDEYVYYEYPDSGGANDIDILCTGLKFIIRWKTSESASSDGLGARVQVVFDDASTEDLLESTGIPQLSSDWTVTTGTITTTGKQIDHVRLYADDNPNSLSTGGVRWVYYDFVVFHTGTFTFPYVSRDGKSGGVALKFHNNYAKLKPPGRQGDIKQWMGADSPMLELTGDMDTRTTWKDSLTYIGQPLIDIFVNADTEPWQWFTCETPNVNCKVVLEDLDLNAVSGSGKKRQWKLLLSKFDQSSGTAASWSGLDYLGL